MAEEIGFENGRNSNFEGLVTLTLTLDPAIRHTVVHHSSTSTYIPIFIQIEETFCGRTDVRTDGRTGGRTFFPSNIIRSTFGSRPKNKLCVWRHNMPPPAVRRTLRLGRCGPAAAHPYACGAQRTLLPIAVGTHEY